MTRYETNEGALRPDYVWRCREPQGRMAADGHIFQERCTPKRPHESCRWVLAENPMRVIAAMEFDEHGDGVERLYTPPSARALTDDDPVRISPDIARTLADMGCGDPECCPDNNDTDQVFASLRNGASFYETTDGLPFGIDVMPAQELQVYVGAYLVTVHMGATTDNGGLLCDVAHVRVERSDT